MRLYTLFDSYLSCLCVAAKLCATCEAQGALPTKRLSRAVLLRIGFTRPQSLQCAGELLPRLFILTVKNGGNFLLHFP